MPQKRRVLVGDFETTVYKGQEYTEVWASALVEVGKDDPNDVKVFHSIAETWDYLKHLHTSITVYYHNLKFDGSFWINYLMNDLEFKPAINWLNDEKTQAEWLRDRDMQNKTFRALISRMGQWYSIKVKIWGNIIEFRDSWKLMPFSVKECGKAFNTKHRKLDMEYTGFRYAGCKITDEELAYIKNDVLVVSEALDIMFKDGHDKLTIGSCCMKEFKTIMGRDFLETYFIPLDAEDDAWIRKAYKGGWCYVAKGKENKMHYGGGTYDVNSLYPSVMHSESGNRYPIGKPHWFKETFPIWYGNDKFYFFLKIRTRFYLKPGKLPTIQIKGNPRYHANEWLETSDYYRYGEWHEDPVVFISHALAPSEVVYVDLNEKDHSALVIVPDNQLSLAIGKKGQNARLAARLTGFKIDIKSGAKVGGGEIPESADLHLAIYKKREDVNFIHHSHNEYVKAISKQGKKMKPLLDDFAQLIGPTVKCAVFAASSAKVVKALGNKNAVLLKDNGAICVAGTKYDAEAVEILKSLQDVVKGRNLETIGAYLYVHSLIGDSKEKENALKRL